MSNGLKVYYTPLQAVSDEVTLPNFWTLLPLIREILIREEIDVVHGHQGASPIAHEGIMHARTMGFPCVFTDHSLFGFGDFGSIHINKLMKLSFTLVSHIICVS